MLVAAWRGWSDVEAVGVARIAEAIVAEVVEVVEVRGTEICAVGRAVRLAAEGVAFGGIGGTIP